MPRTPTRPRQHTTSYVYDATYTRTATPATTDVRPASVTRSMTVAVVDGVTTEADIPAIIAARLGVPSHEVTIHGLRHLRTVEN